MEIPQDLYALLEKTSASASGLVYTEPSQQKVVQDKTDYLISYITALEDKDTSNKKQKTNPFENPDPSLVVSRDVVYSLILNKFPIIKNHFLLITNKFVKQDSLLTPQDLVVTHDILKQLGKDLKGQKNIRPLAFFNCGPASGASQAHKHVQFIFVDEQQHGLWPQDVVDRSRQIIYVPDVDNPPLTDSSKKFAHFVLPLTRERGEEDTEIPMDTFAMIYMGLIQNCLTVMRDHHLANDEENHTRSMLSYNLLMTENWIMAVPRSRDTVSNEELGCTLSINSLGYVGMILVKSKEAFEKIVSGKIDLEEKVLLESGFKKDYEKQTDEGDY
ncbi:bifunctional AP-4-A phosphorylase/ADP sulfurylase [Saccharomycopsis crataegensis]|uniref:Bifunctional AP-4-A phosphorylase/ADP sulfurylase n=1 Tax=Saccharomycopsis crataegensis TaxID=43959 RepID=A0AAV5QS04_9ASCO|nr:bifunctional AP-4-A phosphorylase/ADP sulfurylase [Saccharomycopsis crataegensis]